MCNECDYDRSDAVVGWLSSQTIKNGGPSQKLNKKSNSTLKANCLTELQTKFVIIDCFKNETEVNICYRSKRDEIIFPKFDEAPSYLFIGGHSEIRKFRLKKWNSEK